MSQAQKNLQPFGHGITDVDTKDLITIASGEVVDTSILSIRKGEKGVPRRNKRKHKK